MIRVGDFPLAADENEAIERVMRSGRISEGVEVAAFEKEWAAFTGRKYAVAASSGWGALVLALSSLKHGVYVSMPALTYIATASALVFTGHTPLFADVSPDTFCADGVMLPVDLMGYIAPRGGFIEDACEAHGADGIEGRSELTCYSFYIAHNIQAGELGCVTTDSEDLHRLMKSLKAQGRECACRVCTRSEGRCPVRGHDPRFTHTHIGFNFKTMEFPAALARCQIPKAEEIVAARRQNFHALNHLLAGTPGLTTPYYQPGMSPLAYPIVLDDDWDREEVCKRIEAQGVETRPLFGCIPTQQPAFAHLKEQYEGRLPVSERLGRQAFYVGVHQYLTESDLEAISVAVKGALK